MVKVKVIDVNVLQIAYYMSELKLAASSNIDPFIVSDELFVADAMQRVLQVEQVLGKIKLLIKQ